MPLVHTYLGQQQSFSNFNPCLNAPPFFISWYRRTIAMWQDSWALNHYSTISWCYHSWIREQYLFLIGLMMQSCSEWPGPRLSSLRLHRKNRRKPKETSNTSVCLTVLNTDIARLVTSYSEQRQPGTSCHEHSFSASRTKGYTEMRVGRIPDNITLKETKKAFKLQHCFTECIPLQV